METFKNQIESLVSQGYRLAAAQAKVAHDAILLAMSRCGFKAHSTIKGGVVMSHITNDIRRTTMDMDIAFIRRSISDLSVQRFVRKLNCLPGIKISQFGTISELRHDDYRGKRIHLDVSDSSLITPIRTKLDIGVHTHNEIDQVDYHFELTSASESTELFVNPNEQIFTEKLLSLLRHRTLSTRPKDIFDMYYLIEKVDLQKLSFCFNTLIYSNKKIQPNNINDIIAILSDVFSSRQFMRRLSTAKANWLMIEPSEVVGKLIDFLKTLKK